METQHPREPSTERKDVVVRSLSPHVADLAVLEACIEAEISQEEGVVGKRYLLYSGQEGKPE